jgi:hypothetical protein
LLLYKKSFYVETQILNAWLLFLSLSFIDLGKIRYTEKKLWLFEKQKVTIFQLEQGKSLLATESLGIFVLIQFISEI